jgi:deoxycytidine triphosphate deaminase
LEFEDEHYLVNKDGRSADYKTADGDTDAVLLSLELADDPKLGFAGFVAKKDCEKPIDCSIKKTADGDERYDPKEFWEAVKAEDGKITIEKDSFYIFRSKERFRIPPHMAVDCQAYSESLGDIRIHYAGFAHPFFGHGRTSGTPLIFEVRGHSMDTILRDGDALAKVYFLRMSHAAKEDEKPQVYNEQELQLSACFKEWIVSDTVPDDTKTTL